MRKLHKQCLFCILIEWSACFDTLESGHKAEYHKNMKISWEALQVQCTQAKIRDKSLFGKKSPGCTISNELLLGKKIEVWTPMLNGNLYLRYQCLDLDPPKMIHTVCTVCYISLAPTQGTVVC